MKRAIRLAVLAVAVGAAVLGAAAPASAGEICPWTFVCVDDPYCWYGVIPGDCVDPL